MTDVRSKEKGASSSAATSYVVKADSVTEKHSSEHRNIFGTHPSQRGFKGNCYSCGQSGHMRRTCPKNAKQGSVPHDTGNSAFIMFKGWQQTPAVTLNDTDVKFDIEKHNFCVDSGCTRHICATKELFSVLKLFTEKEKKPVVKVANQQFVTAVGIGEIHLSVCIHSGAT